jgi:serine phosphatase RsbU (regulator of sigma subunit)
VLHDEVLRAVKVFTDTAMQADDITLVVVEYRSE